MFLLPVVVVALMGEMWLIRVKGVFAVCGGGGYEGDMWLIRVKGVFAACGSGGSEGRDVVDSS